MCKSLSNHHEKTEKKHDQTQKCHSDSWNGFDQPLNHSWKCQSTIKNPHQPLLKSPKLLLHQLQRPVPLVAYRADGAAVGDHRGPEIGGIEGQQSQR